MTNIERIRKLSAEKKTEQATAVAEPPPQPAAPAKPKKPKKEYVGKPAAMDGRMAAKGRLPDGSTFVVEYDAETQTWSGTLHIHEVNKAGLNFTGIAPGVFRLLSKLDGMYRESLCAASS